MKSAAWKVWRIKPAFPRFVNGKGDGMMKVLGICASARKNGNTAIMMRKVFEALEKEGIETELVQFAGTVIEPCKACWACAGRGNCVHKNDCFREVFEK